MRDTKSLLVVCCCVGMFTLMGACVSMGLIRPEDLPMYSGVDIVVTKTDGKVLRFDDGNYSVDTLAAGLTLKGKGKAYTDRTRSRSISFSDSIALSDIASVEVHQKSIFYYAGPIVFLSAVSVMGVFLIIWLLSGAPSLKQ